IVMVGSVPNNATNQEIAVVNADGTYDAGFNQTGFLTTGGIYKDLWLTCQAEPNGKILVAGINSDGQQQDIEMERYNANGTLDQSFGINGHFTIDHSDFETCITLYRHSSSVYYLLVQKSDYQFEVVGFDQNGQ